MERRPTVNSSAIPKAEALREEKERAKRKESGSKMGRSDSSKKSTQRKGLGRKSQGKRERDRTEPHRSEKEEKKEERKVRERPSRMERELQQQHASGGTGGGDRSTSAEYSTLAPKDSASAASSGSFATGGVQQSNLLIAAIDLKDKDRGETRSGGGSCMARMFFALIRFVSFFFIRVFFCLFVCHLLFS
jgi:hypothetical protein